jgi:transcription-repair coupling factor (superfamily II helicase)
VKSKNRIINLSGVSEGKIAPFAADIINERKSQCVIIVSSENRAKRLAVDLSFFVRKKIYVSPQDENVFLRYDAKNRDMLFTRLAILKALSGGEDCVVIAPAAAAVKKNPPRGVLSSSVINISVGDDADIENFKKKLTEIGYERSVLVEAKGEFSARGDIVDIFAPDADNPYRIEFFDSEVDSIREFDIDTQRSLQNLKKAEIFPAALLIDFDGAFLRAADNISMEYNAYINAFDKPGNSEETRFRVEQLTANRGRLVESRMSYANIQKIVKNIKNL